jgi:hypothetical protein
MALLLRVNIDLPQASAVFAVSFFSAGFAVSFGETLGEDFAFALPCASAKQAAPANAVATVATVITEREIGDMAAPFSSRMVTPFAQVPENG